MLVYVTDNEMTKYMSNLSNGLEEFFYLLPGHALDVGTEFVESKSSTFKKAVAGELQAKLISLYSKDLYGDHKLRIYEIVTL